LVLTLQAIESALQTEPEVSKMMDEFARLSAPDQ
jgi:hypothetical protein